MRLKLWHFFSNIGAVTMARSPLHSSLSPHESPPMTTPLLPPHESSTFGPSERFDSYELLLNHVKSNANGFLVNQSPSYYNATEMLKFFPSASEKIAIRGFFYCSHKDPLLSHQKISRNRSGTCPFTLPFTHSKIDGFYQFNIDSTTRHLEHNHDCIDDAAMVMEP